MVKRLIIGVLFIVSLTSSSQAQVMLGYSVKDVKNILDEEGYIVKTGYTTDDNIFYITASDNLLYRIYYFSPENECRSYILFIDDTKEALIKYLIDQDYYKVGDTFYNAKYKVTINYNADVELHYYTWTFK